MSNVPPSSGPAGLANQPADQQGDKETRRQAKTVALIAFAGAAALVALAVVMIVTGPVDQDAPGVAIISLAVGAITLVVGLVASARGWGTRTVPPGVAAARTPRPPR